MLSTTAPFGDKSLQNAQEKFKKSQEIFFFNPMAFELIYFFEDGLIIFKTPNFGVPASSR